MDTILIISIFLVFITALVGSYLQHKKRDRVLVELQGFQVITQLVNGQKIWGEMDVFPKRPRAEISSTLSESSRSPCRQLHYVSGWHGGD